MIAGRRSAECDFCCARYGTWVASLGMVLCPECERTGTDRPAREPVLVGDILAGLAGALVPADASILAAASALADVLAPADAPAPPARERSHVRRGP
ncbi:MULTISPECIES: hypothetical protein [unclassified Streptomyces]|uniref:hypothetical protein n=1 Tax=unclassified Streptomyces TaxID=2593676 RepID=UPI0033AF8E15